MENTNNNLERCRVIRDPKELNSEGCRFFIEANTSQMTMMTSTKLRWLTHPGENRTIYTDEQQKALQVISVEKDRKGRAPTFRMQILLYDDPKKLNDSEAKYIKELLQCVGVDMRYLKTKEEQRLRITMKGNKLFLSMSGKQEDEVHEGILYEAENDHSPLLCYFAEKFQQDFKRAKKIKFRNNERLVNADSWLSLLWKWIKSDRGIAIISLCIAIISITWHFLEKYKVL